VYVVRSRILLRLFIFLLGGAALVVGCYGVLLLVEAFDKHGSTVGDIVLFTFGLTLLVLSAVVSKIVIKRTSNQRFLSFNFEMGGRGRDRG
jgi:hypothetical protein